MFSVFCLVTFLFKLSSHRHPSKGEHRRKRVGSETPAEPVVVLDPVSTHEPQTKDQAAEKDLIQCKEDGGEMLPGFKEDSSGRTAEADSSHC